MKPRLISRNWRLTPRHQLAILVLLNLFFLKGYSDVFCPSAVNPTNYTITAENYNISKEDTLVTLSLNDAPIVECNLTIDYCHIIDVMGVFSDPILTCQISSFGVAAVQIRFNINKFNSSKMLGNYTVTWDNVEKGIYIDESCSFLSTGPVSECTATVPGPCLNGAVCTELSVGYSCTCRPGYNGMNCKEGDFKIYCKPSSLTVEFSQPGDACYSKDFACYVAGLDSQTNPYISPNVNYASPNPGLSTEMRVNNNVANATVCINDHIVVGVYNVQYELNSLAARDSYSFNILVKVLNNPPLFGQKVYSIDLLENATIAGYVNTTTNGSCGGDPLCILVKDPDPDPDFGVESLTIVSVLPPANGTDRIEFIVNQTDDSLGFFSVTGPLTPYTKIEKTIIVEDGQNASASAKVVFNILEVNIPLVCIENVISATLDIRVQPGVVIGSVTCFDPNIGEQLNHVDYSTEGLYSDYFSVNEVKQIVVGKSLWSLQPGILEFNVTATGYRPDPLERVFHIPVYITLTVPDLVCNLTLTSTPQVWTNSSVAHLLLHCDTGGLDSLRFVTLPPNDVYTLGSEKSNNDSTMLVITLIVENYQPGEYNVTVGATIGGSDLLSSIMVPMYNPPVFDQPQFITPAYDASSNTIKESCPISATILTLTAITDVPNARVTYSIESGNDDSIFSLYGGNTLSLIKSLRQYAGSNLLIDFKATDTVRQLASNYLWNVTVLDVNDPPTCAQPAPVTVNSNLTAGSFITQATCLDLDITKQYNQLTLNVSTEPSTVSVAIDNNGSIILHEPLPGGLPKFDLVVNVTDGTFYVLVVFNVTVNVIKCSMDTTPYGIIFPETPVNSLAVVNCTGSYIGTLNRPCFLNQTWGSSSILNCTRRALQATSDRIDNLKANAGAHSPMEVTSTIAASASDLANSLNQSKTLWPGDIKQMVGIISGLGDLTQIYKNSTVDRNTLEKLVTTSDVLMGANPSTWAEALHECDGDGALFLVGLDTLLKASLRSDDLPIESPLVLEYIALTRAEAVDDIVFPNRSDAAYENAGAWVLNSDNTAFLKKDAFYTPHEKTKYAVLLYNNISDKLVPRPKTETDLFLKGKVLNSDILSFTVTPGRSVLSPPLLMTFSIYQSNFSDASCGYLNTHASETGVWAADGCTATKQGDIIQCSCNHLTNFALLMSPFGEVSSLDEKILSIISSLGCAISIFCLFITIVVYGVLWKYVKCDRSVLHVNLSVCLIIAYILFLAGVDRTDNPTACKVVAALLHYIYLVVFCIILSEGIEIFKSVSFVFTSKSILCKLIPLSYGLPLVIVGVSLGVTKTEGYGSSTSCWLSTSSGLIWAFIGPVLLILLVNYIILIQVLRIMQNSKQMTNKTMKDRTKSVVRTICVLSPLLGITWVFGVLSVNRSLVVFQYLFAIFNSLQGLAIFICYCLLAHQVRDGFRALRRKHRAKSIDSPNTLTNTQSPKHSGGDTKNGRQTRDPKNASSNSRNKTNETFASDSGYSSSHERPLMYPQDDGSRDMHRIQTATLHDNTTSMHHFPINGHTKTYDVYSKQSQLQNVNSQHDEIYNANSQHNEMYNADSQHNRPYDASSQHSSVESRRAMKQNPIHSEPRSYSPNYRNRPGFDHVSQANSPSHRTMMSDPNVDPRQRNRNNFY